MKKALLITLLLLVGLLIISCNTENNGVKTVKVTIDYKDDTPLIVQELVKGSTFVMPSAISKSNSVFTGWYLNGRKLSNTFLKVDEDITLEAGWYNFDKKIKLNSYEGEKSVKSQNTPIVFSYDTTGYPNDSDIWTWKVDGKNTNCNDPECFSMDSATMEGEYVISLEVNKSKVAEYILTIVKDEVYSVIYSVNDIVVEKSGYSAGQRVELSSLELLKITLDKADEFSNWKVLEPDSLVINEDDSFTMPKSDVLVQAEIIKKKYNVNVIKKESFEFTPIEPQIPGSVVNLPNAVHNFNPTQYSPLWYLDGKVIEKSFIMPERDVELVLKTKYPLNFHKNGIAFEEYKYEKQFQIPGTWLDLPKMIGTVPEGKELVWYISTSLTKELNVVDGKFQVPNSHFGIKAKIENKKYTTTYEMDGWSCDKELPTQIRGGAELEEIFTNPQKDGYKFIEWQYLDNGEWKKLPNNMPSRDIKVRPYGEANSHKIEFNYIKLDGTVIRKLDFNYAYGSSLSLLDNLSSLINLDDYKFVKAEGYYQGEKSTFDYVLNIDDNKFLVPDGDVIVYIYFEDIVKEKVGGIIFYDSKIQSNAKYTFYDSNGKKIKYEEGADIRVLKDAAFYLKEGIGDDRFYVLYPSLLSNEKLVWGFSSNGAIRDAYYSEEVVVATGTGIGYGKYATQDILSYINNFCTGSNYYKLYHNCYEYYEYLFDVYMEKIEELKKSGNPSDYYIPSIDELLLLKESYDLLPNNIQEVMRLYDNQFWSSSTTLQYYEVNCFDFKNENPLVIKARKNQCYGVMIRSF